MALAPRTPLRSPPRTTSVSRPSSSASATATPTCVPASASAAPGRDRRRAADELNEHQHAHQQRPYRRQRTAARPRRTTATRTDLTAPAQPARQAGPDHRQTALFVENPLSVVSTAQGGRRRCDRGGREARRAASSSSGKQSGRPALMFHPIFIERLPGPASQFLSADAGQDDGRTAVFFPQPCCTRST